MQRYREFYEKWRLSHIRSGETTRYCPTTDEMKAIFETLGTLPTEKWLYDTTVILSHTGLRFGELAQMTRDDIERIPSERQLGQGFLQVRHESGHGAKKTKSKYSRKVPINRCVAKILHGLKRSENDDLIMHCVTFSIQSAPPATSRNSR